MSEDYGVPTGGVPRPSEKYIYPEQFFIHGTVPESKANNAPTTRPVEQPNPDLGRLPGPARSGDELALPRLDGAGAAKVDARVANVFNPRTTFNSLRTSATEHQRQRGLVQLDVSYEVTEGKLLEAIAWLMGRPGGA